MDHIYSLIIGEMPHLGGFIHDAINIFLRNCTALIHLM